MLRFTQTTTSTCRNRPTTLRSGNGLSALMAGQLGLATKDYPPRLRTLPALSRACPDQFTLEAFLPEAKSQTLFRARAMTRNGAAKSGTPWSTRGLVPMMVTRQNVHDDVQRPVELPAPSRNRSSSAPNGTMRKFQTNSDTTPSVSLPPATQRCRTHPTSPRSPKPHCASRNPQPSVPPCGLTSDRALQDLQFGKACRKNTADADCFAIHQIGNLPASIEMLA
jgi:hypothetical protein